MRDDSFTDKDKKIFAEMFDDSQKAQSKLKLNQKQRKVIERKWSFYNLAIHFKMQGLFYQYGMWSHLTHKDSDGVGMIWERSQRDPKERGSINDSQIARIISDVCQLMNMMTHYLMKYDGKNLESLDALGIKHQNLFTQLQKTIDNYKDNYI